MNEKVKIILIAAIFIVLMVGSTFLYNYLSENNPSNSNIAKYSTTEPAEDFTVYNEAGIKVNLSNFYGKPIVVNFWATWCGPCTSELPYFEEFYNEYKDDIHFLMVNSSDYVSDVKSFMKDNDYSFIVYYDNEYDASNTYGVRSIPFTLFINSDGKIVNSHMGSMSRSVLEKYIKQLLE